MLWFVLGGQSPFGWKKSGIVLLLQFKYLGTLCSGEGKMKGKICSDVVTALDWQSTKIYQHQLEGIYLDRECHRVITLVICRCAWFLL